MSHVLTRRLASHGADAHQPQLATHLTAVLRRHGIPAGAGEGGAFDVRLAPEAPLPPSEPCEAWRLPGSPRLVIRTPDAQIAPRPICRSPARHCLLLTLARPPAGLVGSRRRRRAGGDGAGAAGGGGRVAAGAASGRAVAGLGAGRDASVLRGGELLTTRIPDPAPRLLPLAPSQWATLPPPPPGGAVAAAARRPRGAGGRGRGERRRRATSAVRRQLRHADALIRVRRARARTTQGRHQVWPRLSCCFGPADVDSGACAAPHLPDAP